LKNEKKKVCFDRFESPWHVPFFRPFATHAWVATHTLGTADLSSEENCYIHLIYGTYFIYGFICFTLTRGSSYKDN